MTLVIHVLTRLESVVTSEATAHLHRLPRLLAAMVAVGTAGALTGHVIATSLLVVGAIGATWLTLWTTTGRG